VTDDGRFSLHNVTEVEESPAGGFYLRRFPREVRHALSPLGRMVAEESAGVEVRFVTESDSFRISLGAEPSCLNPYEFNNLDVTIYRGDFFHSRRTLEAGRVNHLVVTDHGGALRERLRGVSAETLCKSRFSPDVWRVFLGRFPAIFFDLSAYGLPIRRPESRECPARRWLAYGSSITNGAGASVHHLAYIYQAARRLGADVFNQGLSGSCRCEPAVAAYFAARKDWDLITLELGVNMRQAFAAEEFEQRAGHLVGTIAAAHPDRPVGMVSIFPNADLIPFAADSGASLGRRQAEFNQALRRVAGRLGGNVRLLEGSDLLPAFTGLTTDLLHPGDDGHVEIGRLLAAGLSCLPSLNL